ncbi:amiloride-sensitive sodium channel subunit beta-2-like [Ylistrum balloti]|uniref:amiloride-sensitive sodium channel subunit beta-2-like n=1 Tax=Ylistrum balloti TaxID=509963 RepID=UPI002905E30E|nr:amiloride-sensitive sodium channel subunit beta-2-like [Ylistrum balloti]
MREKTVVTDMFTKLQPLDTKKIHTIKVTPRSTRKRSLSDTLKSIQSIKQEASNDKKERVNINEETLGTIIKSMGETSSVHGVSRVFSGTTRRRMMWFLFVVGFFSYFLYQLYVILTHYYSYPIRTSIKVESRPLLLPSVTICNTNPIRMSTIRESGTRIMKKLMDINQPDDVSIFFKDTSGESYEIETLEDFLQSMHNISDTVYDTAYFKIRDTLIDTYDDHLINEEEIQEELDEFYILQQKLQQEYDSLPRSERIYMGHEIEKMLLHCTFAGRACKRPKRMHVSKEYGNCYTFESSSYVATRSGPEYGFQMTLNLETHEAIPHLTYGYGARLVIHQHGNFPLPAEEGITLSPGYETSLGVRMTKISRLGQPYGTCLPTEFFGKQQDGNHSTNIRYSSQACLLDCKETEIAAVCGCLDGNIHNELHTGYLNGAGRSPYCAKSVDDFRCSTAVTKDFLTGNRGCKCPNTCNETVYSRFFSGRLWPTDDYLDDLVELACSKYNTTQKRCPIFGLTKAKLRTNFLKINIYYEDLNFQYLKEEPEYELMNLLSDVGGSLGLFLGASALTIGEILELFVELAYFFVKKRRND